MSRYYSRKNRFLKGFKDCQRFKQTARGSRFGYKCVISCVYKHQVDNGRGQKLGGVYNGWSLSFNYVKLDDNK